MKKNVHVRTMLQTTTIFVSSKSQISFLTCEKMSNYNSINVAQGYSYGYEHVENRHPWGTLHTQQLTVILCHITRSMIHNSNKLMNVYLVSSGQKFKALSCEVVLVREKLKWKYQFTTNSRTRWKIDSQDQLLAHCSNSQTRVNSP